jgi:xylulokinase
MPDLLLGVDIGTSSVKGVICDTEGNILAQASRDHDLASPQPGWAEQSPAIWWANAVAVIRDCLAGPDVAAEHIAAIGTTGMLPALVLVDENGQPLRPSIQQNDARATAEIDDLKNTIDPDAFFEKTGASINQQSIGPKLLWLQRHEPEVWARTWKILGSYDYINYCLTGTYGIESNWALESGLYDIHDRNWSTELLQLATTSPELMPAIHAPTEVIGGILPQVAEETGLKAGTPVVAGTADHVGAALAAGIKENGDLLIKFGSAGDILYSSDDLLLDPRLYIDYHDVPGKYLLNGCMATSGTLVKWFVQQFCQEDRREAASQGQSVYEYLDGKAAALPPGGDGLVVLPYFLGEKTPILDPHARGVFFGLTLYHTRYHIYRAVLESVVFGFRHHVEVLREQGQTPRRVVAAEGGARSPVWRQIASDVLNLPVSYLANNPGASLAAAFVAGIGTGVFSSWDELEKFIVVEGTTYPDAANHDVYEQLFALYQRLYAELKDAFREIPKAPVSA